MILLLAVGCWPPQAEPARCSGDDCEDLGAPSEDDSCADGACDDDEGGSSTAVDGDDLDLAECDAACDAGELRCADNAVQKCVPDSTGCPVWEVLDDCSSRTAYCDPSGTVPVCIVSCVDICEEGEQRCLYNFVQTCQLNAYGCLVFLDTENCNQVGHDCVLSDGVASCSGAEGGSSSADGTTSSSDPSSSSSGSSPSSGASTPSSGSSTPSSSGSSGGSGGSSSTPSAPADEGCTDVCSDGASRCAGDRVQICVPDAEGCLDWSDIEDCAASGLTCDDTGDAAACA